MFLFLSCSLPYLDAPKSDFLERDAADLKTATLGSSRSRCVNIFYFHTRDGFSAGVYMLTGRLYEFPRDWRSKFPAEAMVLDTKWVDREHRCINAATLKEAWYVVNMPNQYFLYGTAGVEGTVYISSQALPERDLKGVPCYGYGCKKGE